MTDLVNPMAAEYAGLHTSSLDEVLTKLEAYTINTHPHAQMLSGPVQGKFLEMISRMIQPKRILEIGTFTGYSALCLCKGLVPGGVLHTIELREADRATAMDYFKQANVEAQIQSHVGDALEIIPGLSETWDLVFLDADKVNYINYYEMILPSLRQGAWLLADNVLFHGEVLNAPVTGKNAKAMEAFNAHVLADERVEQVMLTVRDGLTLIRKL
jgi:caffeoyl-CoA O-methyltransferase